MPSAPSPEARSGQRVITFGRVIDLSRVIYPGIPHWPGDPPVEFQPVASIEQNGYFLRRFAMGEHSGTHMNAPIGFDPNGAAIDSYSPQSLIAAAVVIDVREFARSDSDYALAEGEIRSWESRHGTVPAGSIVLLNTGWQERWERTEEYLGTEPGGGYHFPGFGREAVAYLLTQRLAAGVGTDSAGVDPGNDTEFSVNKLALARAGIVLENLCNLDQLPPTGATLAIGILRLQGGSGSPASVLAMVP
ncbi:MAG: cyclase family protein [Acidobacteriota bacterium]